MFLDSCVDTTNGTTDVSSDGCDYYKRNPNHCGTFDTNDFNATSMCCACNGGETGNIVKDNEN
jgi:hypothetical protein